LQIFNRWGKEVFWIDGPPGASEWRGLDQNGLELSSGFIIFYAKVFFYGLNPAKETQSFSGPSVFFDNGCLQFYCSS